MKRVATLFLPRGEGTFFVAAVVLCNGAGAGKPVEYFVDPRVKVVDCGSLPFGPEWSGVPVATTLGPSESAPEPLLPAAPIGSVRAVVLVASRNRQDCVTGLRTLDRSAGALKALICPSCGRPLKPGRHHQR
jgi:hypothetical protein